MLGGLWVGVVSHPQDEHAARAGTWFLEIGLAAVGWFLGAIGLRRAAYRERSAGYTTLYGDSAAIPLPSKGSSFEIKLFSVEDLWQLDDKTGAVIRQPAGVVNAFDGR